VVKVYGIVYVIVQIQLQQMVENLAKGNPWKQRTAVQNYAQV